jgi:hypothetical protein
MLVTAGLARLLSCLHDDVGTLSAPIWSGVVNIPRIPLIPRFAAMSGGRSPTLNE